MLPVFSMLPVFQYAPPDGTGPGLDPGGEADADEAGGGFLWRRRYRRHLRRAVRMTRHAGYSVSSSAYERMQRQARAYADGNGAG